MFLKASIKLNLIIVIFSWLYHYGTVLDTIAHDDGSLDVIAILDDGNRNKFEKKFHVKLKH